jgi:ribonuclease HI
LALEQQVPIPSHLHGKKLCDLVDAEGNWDWSVIKHWLPGDVLNYIAAVTPPSDEFGIDERIMAGTTNNNFSVAAMYMILDGYGREENTLWSKVWKLHVPERVRTFTWMMLHQRLLTNSLKNSMGLCHAMCAFCGDVEETILHVMRDCPRAKDIWNCVIPVRDRASFFMSEFHHWLDLNFRNSWSWNGVGSWSEFWALCCHCLWTWRNKELYQEDFVRPSRPLPIIMKMVQEYNDAVSSTMVVNSSDRVEALIRWEPPKVSFIKLNTDGAHKGNHVAGCGGVIRGSHGEWLGGFAKGVGDCSAFVAELWGVYEGLRQVYKMGFRKVEVEVDSETVVQVIKSGCSKSPKGSSLIKRICQLLAKDWSVDITHIYREANKCADAMANLGCARDFVVEFFVSCPSHVSDLYNLDLLGIPTPRLVCL